MLKSKLPGFLETLQITLKILKMAKKSLIKERIVYKPFEYPRGF